MKISKDAYGFIKTDAEGNQFAFATSKDGKIIEFKKIFKNKKELTAQQVVDMC